MKLFLTLKAWQVFMLLLGLPVIFQIVAFSLLTRSQTGQAFLLAFVVEMALFVGATFSWIFAIGNQLHRLLPAGVKSSLTGFRITILIPTIYIVALLAGMVSKAVSASYLSQFSSAILWLLVPLHLLSMACIFYCLYVDAKVLKAVELQRPVAFADFVGEFCLLWFGFVGVWILQPRLNKIARQQLR